MADVEGETIPDASSVTRVCPGPPATGGRLRRGPRRHPPIRPLEVPGLPAGDPVEQLRAIVDRTGPAPSGLRVGFRWLGPTTGRRVRPRASSTATSRNGNLSSVPDGIRAVLDWELSHLGDPL